MSDVDERARVLLEETRQELTRADDKSSVLLAVNGIVLAALLAALLAGDVAPRELENMVEWLFWVGATALIAAEVLLCAAVFPQTCHAARRAPPRYFGDIAGMKDVHELREALQSQEDPAERTLDELVILAPAAVKKFRLIAAGQAALAGGVVACSIAGLVGAA